MNNPILDRRDMSPYQRADMDGCPPHTILPTGNEVKCESWDDVRRSGRAEHQKDLIIGSIRTHGPSTRQEIADRTGLPLASVCGRCSALLDAKRLEVVGTVGKPPRQVLGVPEQRGDV